MDRHAVAALPGELIEGSRLEFADALRRGDPEAAARVYAADGRLLLPSAGPLDGRGSIEAFWRAGLDAGMSRFELTPESMRLDPSFACEVGAYTIESAPRDEAPQVEHGRYLIVHRLEPDGTWRRALEVYDPEQRGG